MSSISQTSQCPPQQGLRIHSFVDRQGMTLVFPFHWIPFLRLFKFQNVNDLPPMNHREALISFCVSVPVLSEKMYSTAPSSSFKLVLFALINIFCFFPFGRSLTTWNYNSLWINTSHLLVPSHETTLKQSRYFQCNKQTYRNNISIDDKERK